MKHLTDIEFVNLVDGGEGLAADRRRHLETCESCNRHAEALRDALREAQIDRAPEPSPLFWTYFSARVSDAIRHETPVAAFSVGGWRRHPFAEWAIAASIAVVVMVAVVWRATLHAPMPGALSATVTTVSPAPQAADASNAQPAADDVEADEAWAVVRSAAEGLRWEDAHAIGISAGPGAAEGLALELTADERAELARLLDGEMKRSGA
ncbi:MAG: hypothetical protein ABJC89_08970 [Acidobacteriota bacterium]